MRLFFEIVRKVKGNEQLVTLALLLIDGILEDNRSRIQFLVGIQKSHNKDRKIDLIELLNSFIQTNIQESND